MSFNVGINVREVDGRVAPSIQPAPTSQTGFVIRSDRGLPGKVRRVTSFKEFSQLFGSHRDDAYGAFAVKGFFDNGGAVAYVTRVVRTTGANSADAASRELDDASGSTSLTVTAAYRGEEDPGAWGNRIAVRIAKNPRPSLEDDTFDLFITLDGSEVESWEALNLKAGEEGQPGRDPVRILNDEDTGSKYIKVEVGSGDPGNPDFTDGHTDATDGFLPLEDGKDDSTPSPSTLADAFDRFDVHDIQLLCCPESTSDTVVEAGLTFCENRGDCLFLGHTPQDQDRGSARGYGQDFQGEKVYGALYFPWIRVADPRGGRQWVPPTGHVAGVYARTDRERGVWKAPAGNGTRISGALDVQYHITNANHTDLVKNGSVNAIRAIPGQGIIVDSSRTLSTSPLWLYVNVRLLFNFVKTSLKDGLRWVVQEPNDDRLWNKVKFNTIRPFLLGLWRRGAFGPGSADDVFTIKVDEENNPPENIQQGLFNAEVYFYPSRPAETVVITVGQQEGGGSAGES